MVMHNAYSMGLFHFLRQLGHPQRKRDEMVTGRIGSPVRAKLVVSSMALCLIGAAGMATFAPGAAEAANTPQMAQTETPELSPGGQSTYWPIQKGTNVTMHCWTEGPNADGGKNGSMSHLLNIRIPKDMSPLTRSSTRLRSACAAEPLW